MSKKRVIPSVAAKSGKLKVKRRTKTQIANSQRAKRGWITRRKKQELAKQITNAVRLVRNIKRGLSEKQLKKLKENEIKRKRGKKVKRTVEELEAIIDLQRKQLEVAFLTKDWVKAMPLEYLTREGAVALYPSRLRHMGKITDELIRLIKRGEKKGDIGFKQAIEFIANHYNVPMREIYTLWFSP